MTRNPAARGRADAMQPALVEWLYDNGYLVAFAQALGAGVPDLIVGAPWGELIWVEVKSPGGRLNAKQREWHTRWKAYPRCMPRSVTELRGWMEKRRRLVSSRSRTSAP